MPRGIYMRNKGVDVVEGKDIGQTEIPVTGQISRDDLVIETEIHTDMSSIKSKAEELAFMEEPVEIFLQDAMTPNDEPVVQVAVNGTSVWLKRGAHHTVKRKYVLVLATSKPTTYTTVEGIDRDGAKTVNLKAHVGVKYPFSVMKDTQKGLEWLKQIQLGAR